MFQGIFKSAINDANKNYIFGTGSIPIQIKTAQLATFADGTTKQQGYQVSEVSKLISTMLTGWDADGNKPKSMSNNYLELILSCDNGFVVKKRLQFPHIIAWQNDITPYNIADVYKEFSVDNWLKADDFENPDITLVVEPTDEILTTSTATPPEATTTNAGRFYLYYRNLPVGVNRVHIDFHIKTHTEPIDFDLEIADGMSWKDAQTMLASNEQIKINILLSGVKDVYKFTGAEGNFEEITMHEWSALYQQIISLAPNNKFTHDIYFYLYDESELNIKIAELESDFNLLPVEKIILQDGKYLIADGREVSSSAFGISDYLSVAEGMVVSCANTVHNNVSVIGLYDDNKVIRGSVSLSADDDEVIFTIPAKIRFIRASYLVASKDKFYIHTDFPSSTGYIGDKIDKLIELPISLNMDGYLLANGEFTPNSAWKSSDFVDINFGYTLVCTYYLTKSTYVCIYDKDKNLIASFPGTAGVKKTTITINPNDYPTLKYLRVCSIADISKIDYSTKILSVFGMIPNEGITTPKIAEKAITPAKSSFFVHDPNTDFIKQDNWVANKRIDEKGNEVYQSGFWATGFIPLLPNTIYYNNAIWYGYYAFYDADKNLIEGHGNDASLNSPFTTPVGTAYGRFTCINTDKKNNAWIGLVNNPAPYAEIIDSQYIPALQEKTYCDYEGNELSMFNKCICVGDSLTEGVFNHNGGGTEQYVGLKKYSYPTFLSKLTGIEVNNLGNGGATSAEWYDRHKEDNLSGYDIAIIQLGTNDAARYSGWTETSITGFTNIINKLKSENTNIKIFVSTISKRFGDPGAAGKAVISNGIRQLVLSLADPNVVLLDMEEYAHTGDEQAYECGHYSAYGYWRLAQDYKNIIGYYINSNKNLFRNVQFIGTNYSYSD